MQRYGSRECLGSYLYIIIECCVVNSHLLLSISITVVSNKMSDAKSVPRDSDKEVPVIQLCCVSVPDLQALDLKSTRDFSTLCTVLTHADREQAHLAVSRIDELLLDDANRTVLVKNVIEAGGVQILCEAMKHADDRIRMKATSLMINLLSGSSLQTSKVLNSSPILPTLVYLINHDESMSVQEQAIWALGNITADSPEWSDRVLEAGGIEALLNNRLVSSQINTQKAVWAISNLFRKQPVPQQSYLKQAVPFLLSQLFMRNDLGTTLDVLQTLINITNFQVLPLAYPHCELLVKFMKRKELNFDALRIVGNSVAKTSAYTAMFISAGLLEVLPSLLTTEEMRKVVGCLLSNMCAESSILSSIMQSGIVSWIITAAMTDTPEVKKECIWALANLCDRSELDLKLKLLEMGVLRPLVSYLTCDDRETVSNCVGSLRKLLRRVKNVVSADMLLAQISAEELTATCEEIQRKRVPKAKWLLREMAWLLPHD